MKTNLVGEKFGHWTVLSRSQRFNSKGEKVYGWLCECECGNKRFVAGYDLKQGKSTNCGCKSNRAKNGLGKTRIYRIWFHMVRRCTDEKCQHYHNYGGRGISVCKEWKENFMVFREWALSNGYSDDLTLERMNNDGNYEPDNCRWATYEEQGKNKRNNLYITIDNESKTLTEWSKIAGLSPSTIYCRLTLYGMEGRDLIQPPLRKKK